MKGYPMQLFSKIAKIRKVLNVELKSVLHQNKYIMKGTFTAVEKIFNANAVGVEEDVLLHAGSDVRVKVNIVGSQDTTGLMTSQELEAMAATVISPTVDGAYQSDVIQPQFGILKLRKILQD